MFLHQVAHNFRPYLVSVVSLVDVPQLSGRVTVSPFYFRLLLPPFTCHFLLPGDRDERKLDTVDALGHLSPAACPGCDLLSFTILGIVGHSQCRGEMSLANPYNFNVTCLTVSIIQ